MKAFVVLAGAGLVTAIPVPPSDAPYRSYLPWVADSFIARGVKPLKGYAEAVLYWGFEHVYDFTKDSKYLDWYRNQIDGNVVLPNGTINTWNGQHSLDNYRMGNNFLYWYNRTGEEKYKVAAQTIRNTLNTHPRTPLGGYWHRQPVYPNQMWLDGIFMADSFYARWTRLFDNDNITAWNDIQLQYDLIEKYTRNTTSGLLAHGYDESKVAVWADPITGAAPHVWIRAVGWYIMTLVEALEVWPKCHPGYTKLMTYYTTLATALIKAQDQSGGWWLIMDEPYPGKPGNYIESSGSAMFTLGLFAGIRHGWLDRKKFLAPTRKAYQLLENKFITIEKDGNVTWQGTVDVGSLSGNATYQYYVGVKLTPNDYKGSGPFMVAAWEWETWAKDAKE